MDVMAITSKALQTRLQNEATRLSMPVNVLIETMLVKSLEKNQTKQAQYTEALIKIFKEVQITTSEMFTKLRRETLNTGKAVELKNVYGLGIDATFHRFKVASDHEEMYRREYGLFISHPDTTKIAKFTLLYSLGIPMELRYEVVELVEEKKKKKFICHHSASYNLGSHRSTELMKKRVPEHLSTLYLERL